MQTDVRKDLEGEERKERGTVFPMEREEPRPDKCESAPSPTAAQLTTDGFAEGPASHADY